MVNHQLINSYKYNNNDAHTSKPILINLALANQLVQYPETIYEFSKKLP